MLTSLSSLPGFPQPQLSSSPASEFQQYIISHISPYFRCTSHIFPTRQWPPWPLHNDVIPHMFLKSQELSQSSLHRHHACPRPGRSNTMHTEGLRHPPSTILISHGRINAYFSSKIHTGHFTVFPIWHIPLQSAIFHSYFICSRTVTVNVRQRSWPAALWPGFSGSPAANASARGSRASACTCRERIFGPPDLRVSALGLLLLSP